MAFGKDRLDLLLLSDEQEDFRKAFGEFDDWIRQDLPVFGRDVKDQLERKFGVRDFLTPSTAGPDDAHHIMLPHRPSLALCDLATVVKAAGYTVFIIDNFMRYPWRYKQMQGVIRSLAPRLIGLSTTFLLSPELVRECVEKIRNLTEDAKIVIGGQTVRRLPELHGIADFAVFGPGEDGILAILETMDGKRRPETIGNIAFRDETGHLKYGVGAEKVARLGEKGKAYRTPDGQRIPITDWSLYDRSRENVYGIEFSRGCKYNCYYCSYDRGKIVRDLAEIRSELLANAKLGISKYRIADSNFTDGPPHYKRYPHDVCQLMIDLDLGLQWSCYSRVDDLSDELAKLMRKAGCFGVFFGMESGDDRILKLMRKGHSVADGYKGIKTAQDNGIFVHANFVVGYPGETLESFENTMEFIERSRPDSVTFGHFYLEEHVPVRSERMAEFEIKGHGLDWSHKTMDSDRAAELVSQAMKQLTRDKISTIANEFEFAVLMSIGYSFDEIKEVLLWRKALGGRIKPKEPIRNAPDWLVSMAREVAADQAAMAGKVGWGDRWRPLLTSIKDNVIGQIGPSNKNDAASLSRQSDRVM